MPSEGEQAHRFDAVDREFERISLVGLLAPGDFRVHGRRNNLPGDRSPRDEGAAELDPEPTAELRGIADRAPYALARCAQQNLLFDAIGTCRHTPPPGCAYSTKHLRPGATHGLR